MRYVLQSIVVNVTIYLKKASACAGFWGIFATKSFVAYFSHQSFEAPSEYDSFHDESHVTFRETYGQVFFSANPVAFCFSIIANVDFA